MNASRTIADSPSAPVLLRLVPAPGDGTPRRWQDQALCAEVDTDLFFPEDGGSVKAPKRVCRGCPVRAECLEYALGTGQRHGVWGGLSEHERRVLRRQAS